MAGTPPDPTWKLTPFTRIPISLAHYRSSGILSILAPNFSFRSYLASEPSVLILTTACASGKLAYIFFNSSTVSNVIILTSLFFAKANCFFTLTGFANIILSLLHPNYKISCISPTDATSKPICSSTQTLSILGSGLHFAA